MLMMLALSCSGPARGPADADDARLVVLRPSKGPADADDARLVVPLRPSKGPSLMMLALSCSGPARGRADADDARLVVLRPSKGQS